MTDSNKLPKLPNAELAHTSRVYDYLLGGKDNLATDRKLAEENLQKIPDARDRVRAQRLFLERAVKYLVGEVGIRQLLDIGAGMPQAVMSNVHEIALHIAPDCRIVYVDSNLVAIAHWRGWHADGKQIAAAGVWMQEPEEILRHPETQALLNLDEPVGVLLSGLLHFIPDEDDPAGLVSRLHQHLAPGSHFAITHLSYDVEIETSNELSNIFADTETPMFPRSRSRIEEMLTGLEKVLPGMVPLIYWRPDMPIIHSTSTFGVVAVKPRSQGFSQEAPLRSSPPALFTASSRISPESPVLLNTEGEIPVSRVIGGKFKHGTQHGIR